MRVSRLETGTVERAENLGQSTASSTVHDDAATGPDLK